MRAILPINGVPEELLRAVNERLRELEQLIQPAADPGSTALPNVIAPGRFVAGVADAKGRIVERSGLRASDLPGFSGDFAGDVNTAGVYKVAGTQVVSARGAALTASGIALAAAPATYNPAFEATVVTICNNLKTRVDELQARLQAHGLIS